MGVLVRGDWFCSILATHRSSSPSVENLAGAPVQGTDPPLTSPPQLESSKQAPGTLLPEVSEKCTHIMEGNPLTSQATPLVDGVC
jgi:hypothetical protein